MQFIRTLQQAVLQLRRRSIESSTRKKLLRKLRAIAKSEIRMTRVKSDAPLDVCASRHGGVPAVPPGFTWPRFSFTWSEHWGREPKEGEKVESKPLAFMAQINLRDVAELDEEHLLPKSGILSFFYELESMEWGGDPKNKGCARVFYFPDEAVLATAEYPDDLDEEYQIPEYALEFRRHVSLPDFYQLGEHIDVEDKAGVVDSDFYEECCEELGYGKDEWEDVTKLLGFPNVIQNPMERECEYASRGLPMWDSDDDKLAPEVRAQIDESAKDWRTLFQMGTIDEDDYDLMFEDGGYIYFWIKKEDLLKRNFDNIWLILQCY